LHMITCSTVVRPHGHLLDWLRLVSSIASRDVPRRGTSNNQQQCQWICDAHDGVCLHAPAHPDPSVPVALLLPESQPALWNSLFFPQYIYIYARSKSGYLGGSKNLRWQKFTALQSYKPKGPKYHGSRIITTPGCRRRRRRQTVAAR
jgi:hypothetical protein